MKNKEAKAVCNYYSNLFKNDIDSFCNLFATIEILARDGVEYDMYNRVLSNLKCLKRTHRDTYENILQRALKSDGQTMKEKDKDLVKKSLEKKFKHGKKIQ
jgi:Zn-finger protein